jgi:DNA-binding XRE family transcriptional regulator
MRRILIEAFVTIRHITLNGRKYVMIPRHQWDAFVGTGTGKALKQPPRLPDGSFTIEHVRISLANKMIAKRKNAGLTQAQLAKQARVRVETISRLENGLHMPGVRTFDKIDRALNRAKKTRAA